MKRITKRAAAVFLSLCLLAAFAVPAYAENVSGGSAQTEVTYTATASYIVVIPSTLTVSEGGDVASGEIRFTRNTMPLGSLITVSVNTADCFEEDGNFYLTNQSSGDKIRCSVSTSDHPISSANAEVLSLYGGLDPSSAIVDIIVQLSDTGRTAGTYTGTLRFAISVTDPE